MPSETVADHVFGCTKAAESHESGSLCAICFEKRPFVDIPCACKIDYCANCWDRALAVSIRTRRQAQCPSCRSGIDVDFNQEDACLVFSKTEKGMNIMDWRSRIYDKILPVQIKLLKDFGAMAGAVMKGESSPRDSPCHEPICICGGTLEKVDTRMRIIRMLEDITPEWKTRISEDDQRIDQLTSKAIISCDLCNDIATRTGFVWTCGNGPYTVLHPAAYDICESCVSLYAGCSSVPSNTSAASSSCSSQNSRENASRSPIPFSMVSLPGQRHSPQTSAEKGGNSLGIHTSPAPGLIRTRTEAKLQPTGRSEAS